MLILLPLVGSSEHIATNPAFILAVEVRTATTSFVTVAGIGTQNIDLSQQEVEDLIASALAAPVSEFTDRTIKVKDMITSLNEMGAAGWFPASAFSEHANFQEVGGEARVFVIFSRPIAVS